MDKGLLHLSWLPSLADYQLLLLLLVCLMNDCLMDLWDMPFGERVK